MTNPRININIHKLMGRSIYTRKKTLANKLFLYTCFFVLLTVLCVSPGAAHTAGDHPGVTGSWTAISTQAQLMAISSGGNYYLTNNITITESWKVPGVNINFCLNGYWINNVGTHGPNTAGAIDLLVRNCYFNLYECNTTVKHYFVYDYDKDCWVMDDSRTDSPNFVYGGVIMSTGLPKEGGGVFVDNGAIFRMHGGNIAGSVAKEDGGGVCVKFGEFEMYGGSISYNKAGTDGGGIRVLNGVFTIEDGTISHNTAVESGGGIRMEKSPGETLIIKGGSIEYNAAGTDGGGVYMNNCKFDMSGGNIIGNTAGGSGGGVIIHHGGKFILSGGNIAENHADVVGGGVYLDEEHEYVTISGSPTITDNTRSEGAADPVTSNLYLHDGDYIAIGAAGLESGASIGVTTEYAPTSGHNIDITEGAIDPTYASYFIADRDNEDIVYDSVSDKLIIIVSGGSAITYTVTIPDEIVLQKVGGGLSCIEIATVDELHIGYGEILYVSVQSQNGFEMRLVGNPGYSMGYSMTAATETSSETYSSGTDAIVIMSAGYDAQPTLPPFEKYADVTLTFEVTQNELENAVFAGDYRDLLTFRVYIEDPLDVDS